MLNVRRCSCCAVFMGARRWVALAAGLLLACPPQPGADAGPTCNPSGRAPAGRDASVEPVAPPPMAQFCDAYAEAYCQWRVDCGHLSSGLLDLCKGFHGSGCLRDLAGVREGRRAYSAVAAAGCLEALHAADCWTSPPACVVTVPARQLGETCQPVSLNDCIDGFCPNLYGLCGAVCTPYTTNLPLLENEGPCLLPPRRCGPELFCDPALTDGGVCRRLLPDGVSCTLDEQCAQFRCSHVTDAGRVCGYAPVGAPCEAPYQCDPATSFCDVTCQALEPAGAPCDGASPISQCANRGECIGGVCVASECLDDFSCPRGQFCHRLPEGRTVCRPLPLECEACGGSYRWCGLGLGCAADGLCRPIPSEHEPCTQGSCGELLTCSDAGTCERWPAVDWMPKGTGEACRAAEACESLRCLNDAGYQVNPPCVGPCTRQVGTCAPPCP